MELSVIAKAGLEIVRKASIVAKKAQVLIFAFYKIQAVLLQNNIVSKQDLSPVTVIDFAVQASIAIYLQQVFPNEEFRFGE